MKNKSQSRFIPHAVTPLKEPSKDAKKGERMEMKTYRKYKGIYLHMLNRKKDVGFIIMYTVAGAIVSVDHFNNYVKNMHGDRDQQFENEYSVS